MIPHQRRKSKLSCYGTRANCSQNFVDSAVSVACNLVIFPGAPSFPGIWAISGPLVDQRMQTRIGRKHQEIIDAARESAIARPKSPFNGAFI